VGLSGILVLMGVAVFYRQRIKSFFARLKSTA